MFTTSSHFQYLIKAEGVDFPWPNITFGHFCIYYLYINIEIDIFIFYVRILNFFIYFAWIFYFEKITKPDILHSVVVTAGRRSAALFRCKDLIRKKRNSGLADV